MQLNAAQRLIESDMKKSSDQQFNVGDKVKIVEPFYFDDGKLSRRMLPGVVKNAGQSAKKERGQAPGYIRYQYAVQTQYGTHTFEQDDLVKG